MGVWSHLLVILLEILLGLLLIGVVLALLGWELLLLFILSEILVG